MLNHNVFRINHIEISVPSFGTDIPSFGTAIPSFGTDISKLGMEKLDNTLMFLINLLTGSNAVSIDVYNKYVYRVDMALS